MQRFNLKCSEETGIFAVHECISAERNLRVRLSYHGLLYHGGYTTSAMVSI